MAVDLSKLKPVSPTKLPINFKSLTKVPAGLLGANFDFRSAGPVFDVEGFMDNLAASEGTTAHKSKEGGVDTQAFGVKFDKGVVRDAADDDRSFAKRVVLEHEKEVVKKVGKDKWKKVSKDVKTAVMDLKFNMGIGAGVAAGIKSGNVKDIMENTMDTIGSKMTNSNTKIVVAGIAKRRAEKWNLVYPMNQISKVDMERVGKKTEVKYLDDNGDVVFSYNTDRVISRDFKTEINKTSIDIK